MDCFDISVFEILIISFVYFQLLIRATDNGNASLTNQFLLTVLVVDIDDNKPAFNACRDVEVSFVHNSL